MIYLNNAATSYPKPPSVVDATIGALRAMPASALRSSLADDQLLPTLRERLGELFHIADTSRIFLASGATDALNRVIGGLNAPAIVATDNHNSVLRPICNRRGTSGYQLTSLTPDLESLREMLDNNEPQPGTLLVVNHCSNVTGHIHDLSRICQLAHEHGLLVLADVSQSAGCIPVDVDGWGIDLLAFTGHKALMGPQGTGGYYVREGIDLRPTMFGGTGRDSSIITYEDGNWEYEVGTPNLPGLAGLSAGVEVVLRQGVHHIFEQERAQANWLIDVLRAIAGVKVYSTGGETQGPVVSFNIKGLLPSDVGYILQNSYGITVRTGLHCAPLIHQELGTAPQGTVRASLSCHTTDAHLQALVDAVGEISRSL